VGSTPIAGTNRKDTMFDKALDFVVAICGLLMVIMWALYAFIVEPDYTARHAALCQKTKELPLQTLDAGGNMVYACVSSNYRAVTTEEILKHELE
jgi:hypothetical protein